MFEPQENLAPILKFPLKSMEKMPMAELFDEDGTISDGYLTFITNSVIEMKENGRQICMVL